MFKAVRRWGARLVVVASAAAIAAGPAVVAHAQTPIATASVIVHSLEDLDTWDSEPLEGVTVQAIDAAGNLEDECVTNANGSCTVGFTSEGEHSVCIVDIPEIYELEPGGCVTLTVEAGRNVSLLFFLAEDEGEEEGEEEDGDDIDGDGNGDGDDIDVDGDGNDVDGDGDDVDVQGDADISGGNNTNTGSGQICSANPVSSGSLLSLVIGPVTNYCNNAPTQESD
jgi:hypothetical protein